MILFGVTGGIGSGKSVVCGFLKKKGVPILEADPLAKKLTNTLPEIRTALMAEFGQDIYAPHGDLNKETLRHLVFTNSATRQRVNQIIHPHVFDWIHKEAERLDHEEHVKLVGVEAALVYESGMEKMLDVVVVVDAPVDKRVRWIQQRNQLSEEEIRKRLQAQMPAAEKRKRADYVVVNDGTLKDLERKVVDLLEWLSEKAE